jgi:DNA polymerase I
VRGPLFDTMIAASLLNPERRGVGMDDLARDLLGVTTTPISELIGKGKQQRSMLDVPMEQLLPTPRRTPTSPGACTSASTASSTRPAGGCAAVRRTSSAAGARAGRDGARRHHARRRAAPAYRAQLASASTRCGAGARTWPAVRLQRRQPQAALAGPVRAAEAAGGEEDQDRLLSTDAEVLETLASETGHPLPALVLEYRELTKLLGTYVDPLPSFVSKRTGRLHASFHQTGAATGRLSSSDPNIQNIPIRSDAGREIRRAFVARDDDHLLLAADYSQVELRFLAHFSEDEELLRAFREGLDIHAYVASQIFERAARTRSAPTSAAWRRPSTSASSTVRVPSGSRARCASRRPTQGLHRGLQGALHRPRPLPPALHRGGEGDRRRRDHPRPAPAHPAGAQPQPERARARRAARDQHGHPGLRRRPHQARDGAPRARLDDEGMATRLLIQVHDELVLETPKAEAERATAITVDAMANALELRVPLVVDASVGPNWLEGKG